MFIFLSKLVFGATDIELLDELTLLALNPGNTPSEIEKNISPWAEKVLKYHINIFLNCFREDFIGARPKLPAIIGP